MKRLSIILLMTILMVSLFAQNGKENCFITTFYNESGEVIQVKTDTLWVNGELDIDFYEENFHLSILYPERFMSAVSKDTTIIIWNDTAKEKDYFNNWTHTFVYDSLSRVTDYIYSGCLICSQFPYNLKLYYDNKNRPVKIERRFGIGYKVVDEKLVKSGESDIPAYEFRMQYDKKGNLFQLDYLQNGKPYLTIEMLKEPCSK